MFYFSCSKRGSFTRNSFCKAAIELKEGFGLKIGNGESSFWYDDWRNMGALCNEVFAVDIHDVNLRVCDLWNDSWNLQRLYTQLPQESIDSVQFPQFCSIILCAGYGDLAAQFIGIGLSEILKAELLAILHGLKIAWDRGYKWVACYSDSQLALSLVNNHVAPCHRYATIITKIHIWMAKDWRLSFHHLHRQGNQCVDYLAKKGASSVDTLVNVSSHPQDLSKMLLADALGVAFLRD
ncbi:Ribonuclease H domain [Sesbania bispinosa]|nr:Ribonuclease H domain [Sesbania bispinosa]